MKKVLITNNSQMHLTKTGGYGKQLYYLFHIFKEFGYDIYYLMYNFKFYNNESYLKVYTYDEMKEIYSSSIYNDIILLDDDILKNIFYLSIQNEDRIVKAEEINTIIDNHNINLFFCLGDAFVFEINTENAYKVPNYFWYPCHFYPLSKFDFNGLNSFSNILSLSPSIKIALEQQFPSKKIYYLPHIVMNQDIKLSKEEIRKKWNIPNDKYIVLLVCHLFHEQIDNYVVNRKSIDTQMIAFKKFNEKYNNSILFIHSIKNKYTITHPMEDLINSLEFTKDNFIWNKDKLDEHNLHELYEMSDIFLSCSKGEGFGVPILEAQKYNTNVITNNFCSMKEHNFQNNIVEVSTYSIHYGINANWVISSSDNIFKMIEKIYLNQRRIESAPADSHSSWSMTDKYFNSSPLGQNEIFSGLNNSDNNKIRQNRSKWIVNELTSYTNIKKRLYKILHN